MISRTVLRDFAGLENMDEDTTAAEALELVFRKYSWSQFSLPSSQALLNFSYHLACGNTDEATDQLLAGCVDG